MSSSQKDPRTSRHDSRLLFLAAGLVVLGLVTWQLADLLLLVFGALFIAVLLRSLTDVIAHRSGMRDSFALAAAIATITIVLVIFVYLLGSRIQTDLTALLQRMPELISAIETKLGFEELETWAANQARRLLGDSSVLSDLANISATLAAAAVNVLLVLIGGIYFAADPHLYRRGFLLLFPTEKRASMDEAITCVSETLRLWLLGQLLSMIIVGALTTASLLLLGLPNAFALGLLAGLLEFVPFVGPIASAIPALAVALAESAATAAWTIAIYIAVQQLEQLLVVPLIQRRTVRVPPAVTLFAVLAFGLLFGPVGVLFAAPLAVTTFALVKKLWVEDELGTAQEVQGRSPQPSEAVAVSSKIAPDVDRRQDDHAKKKR